jgi:pimeloyl-ACP methyl ester carboxylesterase
MRSLSIAISQEETMDEHVLNATTNEGYVLTDDGVRLFYRTVGDGPQRVIIPNAAYMSEEFKYLADGRTLVFYDLRNRGRSDQVTDGSKLKRGIHHDVEDLETIRRHFGFEIVDVIGHSYLGFVVMLYAMRHPDHVGRVVQIGPPPPSAGKQYPAHLTGADATLADISAKLAQLQLQQESQPEDPKEFATKYWSLMRVLYVTDPGDVDKINWSAADLPNESLFNVMKHFNENLLPSIQALALTADDFGRARMPVLTIHGTRDRQVPYGGGREWVCRLPNARLVTVENAAHLPWIEAPQQVFGSIETFLDGGWPDTARRVESIDPDAQRADQQL